MGKIGTPRKGVNLVHGHNTREGQTPEYTAWCGMIGRCYNSNNRKFKDYGGRGISVCDRWRDSFISFLEDMGEKPSASHSLDRIDNNGNYEPGNCRWATVKEQSRNKRNVTFIEIDGISMTAAEWAKLSGQKYETILYRIKKGWSNRDSVFFKAVRGNNHLTLVKGSE